MNFIKTLDTKYTIHKKKKKVSQHICFFRNMIAKKTFSV